MNLSSLFAIIASLALLFPKAPAQSPSATAVKPRAALPANPLALLQIASEINGLHADRDTPWHARIRWQILAAPTRILSEGTYEEWWDSPRRYRIIWAGSDMRETFSGYEQSHTGFQQTLYRTPQGLAFTGSAHVPTRILDLVDDAIRLPLPSEAGSPLAASQTTSNGVSLRCVSRGPDLALAPQSGRLASAYEACFSGNPPVLRLEQGIGIEALFDSPVQFEGRWLARKIRFLQEPGSEIDLTLEQIESLGSVAEAEFTPPPGAAPVPVSVHLPVSVLQARRIPGGLPPSYPPDARRLGIQGTVLVAVVVRRDGLVASVHAVSGPPALQHAAMVAVAGWRFHPYLQHGQPVEVEGEVSVTFTLPPRH